MTSRVERPVEFASTAEVLLVGLPGCRLCDEARTALEDLRLEFPITVREVDPLKAEGVAIVEHFRPATWPVTLLNDDLFSVGRLPRTKLRRRLERDTGTV